MGTDKQNVAEDEPNFVFDWEHAFSESNQNTTNSGNPSFSHKENNDSSLTESTGFFQNTNTVSGVGIYDDDEENQTPLADLLKEVNAHNADSHKEEMEKLRKEEEEREKADQLIREKNRAKLLQELAEEEAKEREKQQKIEEEEEKRLAEEAEAKRKANPFFKIKDAASDLAAKQAAASAEKKRKALEAKEEEKKKKEAEKSLADKESSEKSEPAKPTKPKKEKAPKENPSKEKSPKTEKAQSDTPDFEYLATHDRLTGMKNLTAYDMDVKKCDAEKLAILFFDINDLKKTNDTLGHTAGNKLITTVSEELAHLFEDAVYRIGGDEFVVLFTGKNETETRKTIEQKITSLKSAMSDATKEDNEGITYSVSVGYSIGDGKKTTQEMKDEADKAMYADKQAYKEKQKKEKKTIKSKTEEVDHDSLLSEEQQMLKYTIKGNHSQASEESTEKILREIQSRCNEVVAVLVADKNFDSLFILQDVDSFIRLVAEMENLIDYSYLYVVYEGGTQFYGIDEYFDEVTDLFKEIGAVINTNAFVSEKELLKIKGINIFKNIYFD